MTTSTKFGQQLYDAEIVVQHIFCLDILDANRCPEALTEILDDFEAQECAEVFGLPVEDVMDWMGDEFFSSMFLDFVRSGWLVRAEKTNLLDITFRPDGSFGSAGLGCWLTAITVYAPTFEEAIERVITRAEALDDEAIAKARKEQGIPEPQPEVQP